MTIGRPRLKLEGHTFGRLTVLAFDHIDSWSYSVFKCRCSCGKVVLAKGKSLKSGHKRSCGCLIVEGITSRSTTHGESGANGSREYAAWSSMHSRCENPNVEHFIRYGGRGIKVCRRWRKFENFLADMGRRPHGESLDRINNDGNYTPTNCHWATPRQQVRNSTITKLTEHNVQKIKFRLRCAQRHHEIAEIFGVNRSTIGKISRGERWADIP